MNASFVTKTLPLIWLAVLASVGALHIISLSNLLNTSPWTVGLTAMVMFSLANVVRKQISLNA